MASELLDERAVRVLDALFSEGGVRPCLSLLAEKTGLTRPTLSASLAALRGHGALVSYWPILNFRAMGIDVDSLVLLDFDISKKSVLDRFAQWCVDYPNVRFFGSVASSRYNLAVRELYPSVEAFHAGMLKLYQEDVPDAYGAVRARSVYFVSDPVYAYRSFSQSVAEVSAAMPLPGEQKKIQVADAPRRKILHALFEPGVLRPHLRTLQRKTGMHLATLSSVLSRLQSGGVLRGFAPRMNPLAFGFHVFGFVFLQLPPSPALNKLIDFAKNDPHLLLCCSMAASEYNLFLEFLHPDIRAFNRALQEYYTAIPEMVSCKREIVYVTPPIHKDQSRSLCALNILKRQHGL